MEVQDAQRSSQGVDAVDDVAVVAADGDVEEVDVVSAVAEEVAGREIAEDNFHLGTVGVDEEGTPGWDTCRENSAVGDHGIRMPPEGALDAV